MRVEGDCGKEEDVSQIRGMSYSGMEYLPDEISLDKRKPTSRT
jgi:hypothetical protein